METQLRQVFEYHETTKHHFRQYARGPGYLDWATQPDGFRRYGGAPLISLEKTRPDSALLYDEVMTEIPLPARTVDRSTLSSLFFHSLALSAWKRVGSEQWALRVNPSSGNLHPTESYLICGPIEGLQEVPAVFHYAPGEHALELRGHLPGRIWEVLTAGMPPQSVFVALSSIHWREAWKYGERAYRYCQLDVGHALGAIGTAAAALGWRAVLLDHLGADQVAALAGLGQSEGVEAEHADCLIVVFPGGGSPRGAQRLIDPSEFAFLTRSSWLGKPNQLSSSHVYWEIIDEVAGACRKPAGLSEKEWVEKRADEGEGPVYGEAEPRMLSFHSLVRRRRSAVSMDGVSTLDRASFYRILQRLMPSDHRPPFSALPWPAMAHCVCFAHRVTGLPKGLYLLCRDEREQSRLRAAMRDEFLWEKPEDCPKKLPFYLLVRGDFRKPSMQIACFQEIASEGCFSLAMLARFEEPLRKDGAWRYPRLYWECGMIGQVLYLEAEAAGLRGTGIGCFFDDACHQLLGLEGRVYQDLYHFTVGGPIEDPRLSTLPAYSE